VHGDCLSIQAKDKAIMLLILERKLRMINKKKGYFAKIQGSNLSSVIHQKIGFQFDCLTNET